MEECQTLLAEFNAIVTMHSSKVHAMQSVVDRLNGWIKTLQTYSKPDKIQTHFLHIVNQTISILLESCEMAEYLSSFWFPTSIYYPTEGLHAKVKRLEALLPLHLHVDELEERVKSLESHF